VFSILEGGGIVPKGLEGIGLGDRSLEMLQRLFAVEQEE